MPSQIEPWPIQLVLSPDFRPSSALSTKPRDRFRVVVAGDSYAYGLGVRAGEALPAQLAGRFSPAADRAEVEVLNLGCPGLSLFNLQALVRQIVDSIELDVVLLVLSSDDSMPWLRQEAASLGLDWTTLWSSRWDPDGEVFRFALDALDVLVASVRGRGAQVAVAYFEPRSASGARAIDALGPACRERAIPFIDLVSPFSRFEAARLVVSPADLHPSPLAHRIAAAEVEQTIRRMLPPRTAHLAGVAREAVLVEHLDALDAAHADVSTVVQQLLESTALAREERSELAAQFDGCLRYAGHLQGLREAEALFAWLSSALVELDRRLLLSRLGVAGYPSSAPAGNALFDLEAAARSAAETAGGAAARLQAVASQRSSPAIASVAERIESEWGIADRAIRRSLSGIVAICGAATSLVRRWSPASTPPAVTELAGEIREVLRRMERLARPPPEDHACEAIVEGAVNVDSDVTCAMLTSTFASSYPSRRTFQQLNYLRLDGRPLACVFDLPAATVGRLSLKLSLWRGGAEVVMGMDPGLRCSVVGVSGAVRPLTDEVLVVGVGVRG